MMEWKKLTGDLSYEERELVIHICNTGLTETRSLLKIREHETGKAQTQGAILAFETILDCQFTTCAQFIDQYQKLEERYHQLHYEDDDIIAYWKMRGQQLQLEFILERILVYRIMTANLPAAYSARAAVYVAEWMRGS